MNNEMQGKPKAKRRTREERIELITEVENGIIPPADWYRMKGISKNLYDSWHGGFKRDGTLQQLRQQMDGFEFRNFGDDLLVSRQMPYSSKMVHITCNHQKSFFFDYLFWKIKNIYGMDPMNGDRYVFMKKGRRQCTILQYVDGVKFFTSWGAPKRIFYLPEQVSDSIARISKEQLAFLCGPDMYQRFKEECENGHENPKENEAKKDIKKDAIKSAKALDFQRFYGIINV